MSTPTTLLPFQPSTMSTAQLAAVSFLARYSARTHHLYQFQLREWFAWCERNGLDPLVGEDKAAALLHLPVRNHALVDGNKRLAWSATRIFHLLNGRDLSYTVDDAEDLMLRAAAGQLDVPEIALWLAARLRPPS